MGLNLPRRTKKRLPDRPPQPLDLATEPNRCWALDFMHDALYCGRRFRTLNVIDEANRECLAIEVATSIPAARLIRVLSRLVDYYGTPDAIRLDNGPEMVSGAFTEWAASKGIAIRYIQPGKPNQNAFIERFNRTYLPNGSPRCPSVCKPRTGSGDHSSMADRLQRIPPT